MTTVFAPSRHPRGLRSYLMQIEGILEFAVWRKDLKPTRWLPTFWRTPSAKPNG